MKKEHPSVLEVLLVPVSMVPPHRHARVPEGPHLPTLVS
ncbi:hypothetical protein HMPREF9207_2126 [Cutibacterium acnes J165]|nr:hypothetical protein HMPREF1034_1875 [Cutibacterium acnes SK187]EFD06113.1 hypothetical protein HMPREF9207_2126 [Cutibacterium acnes J165]EGL43851.1 hypothetical protein HMPREF9947_1183 [Propionibacterium sp. 409-HC1]